MHAIDVMTAPVITAGPDSRIDEIANLLLRHHISAVPIVDDGKLLGIVSEGDLIRQLEPESGGRGSWWLSLLSEDSEKLRDYVKSHGKCARDIMTRDLITVQEETPIGEIALLLEKNRIKRVLVLRDGALAGVVSRANLLHGLAAAAPAANVDVDDRALREHLEAEIDKAGIHKSYINVVVSEGTGNIYGTVPSEDDRKALAVACDNVPGLKAANVEVGILNLPGYGV